MLGRSLWSTTPNSEHEVLGTVSRESRTPRCNKLFGVERNSPNWPRLEFFPAHKSLNRMSLMNREDNPLWFSGRSGCGPPHSLGQPHPRLSSPFGAVAAGGLSARMNGWSNLQPAYTTGPFIPSGVTLPARAPYPNPQGAAPSCLLPGQAGALGGMLPLGGALLPLHGAHPPGNLLPGYQLSPGLPPGAMLCARPPMSSCAAIAPARQETGVHASLAGTVRLGSDGVHPSGSSRLQESRRGLMGDVIAEVEKPKSLHESRQLSRPIADQVAAVLEGTGSSVAARNELYAALINSAPASDLSVIHDLIKRKCKRSTYLSALDARKALMRIGDAWLKQAKDEADEAGVGRWAPLARTGKKPCHHAGAGSVAEGRCNPSALEDEEALMMDDEEEDEDEEQGPVRPTRLDIARSTAPEMVDFAMQVLRGNAAQGSASAQAASSAPSNVALRSAMPAGEAPLPIPGTDVPRSAALAPIAGAAADDAAETGKPPSPGTGPAPDQQNGDTAKTSRDPSESREQQLQEVLENLVLQVHKQKKKVQELINGQVDRRERYGCGSPPRAIPRSPPGLNSALLLSVAARGESGRTTKRSCKCASSCRWRLPGRLSTPAGARLFRFDGALRSPPFTGTPRRPRRFGCRSLSNSMEARSRHERLHSAGDSVSNAKRKRTLEINRVEAARVAARGEGAPSPIPQALYEGSLGLMALTGGAQLLTAMATGKAEGAPGTAQH